MSWGIGAFIVTFAVLSYFLGGTSTTQNEFLANAAIAAVVAVLAGLWLGGPRTSSSATPGEFDERATRRAVRRGVVRTALVVVVWLFFGAIALSFGSHLWQTRGGRDEHFDVVVGHGLPATLPGWNLGSVYCCNTGIRSLELSAQGTPVSASPLTAAQQLDLSLHINLHGRLSEDNWLARLPATGVDAAFGSPASASSAFLTKSQLRAQVSPLPDGVAATAVVELRRPTAVGAFYRLLARHGIVYPDSSDVHVFLQRDEGGQYVLGNGAAPYHRVSWPHPAVAGFQDWVKQLHTSDDGLLHDLQLPDVTTLRALAAHPRIYGFVLSQADRKQLLAFLDDPRVETLRIGDIAYNLSTGA